ncbi:unnamed protein product [Sphagnum balticum]
MTRTRGRMKERRWRKEAKRGFEDLRKVATSALTRRETHTLSLSPFRFEEKTRAVGRKAQWDPANQPASQPASSVRTCVPTFRLPAVPRVGTFNLQPAALKNAARECGNARESLQTLLQHFVME